MAGHPDRPGNRPPEQEHRARSTPRLPPTCPGGATITPGNRPAAGRTPLDPNGAADRARKAVTDRRVTIRPAIELHLVMTDRALADRDDEPAHLVGHGPVPAPIARDLLATDARRRDSPKSPACSSPPATRSAAPPSGRPSLRGRHQAQKEGTSTKGVGCAGALPIGAPIREADHAVAVSKGGSTDLRNGNGRCTNCNLVK